MGLRVAAHCHGTAGIRSAVAARIDMLEHCSFQGRAGYEYDPALAREIAAAGIVVSPTVSIGWTNWPDDGRREERGRILRDMFDAGCEFVMSTDCGIPGVPHEELRGGLRALVDFAGRTPAEALALATSQSARLLGLSDRGLIEVGRRADLLVVEGDPLDDLGALSRVRAVVRGGELAA
jgi:imidazolonepropionase-like amidohydrolase